MNVSDNMADESTLTVAPESLVTPKQYMNPYDPFLAGQPVSIPWWLSSLWWHSLYLQSSIRDSTFGKYVWKQNAWWKETCGAMWCVSFKDDRSLHSKYFHYRVSSFVYKHNNLIGMLWEHKKILANDLRFMIYKFLLWSPNSCIGYYPGKPTEVAVYCLTL